MDRNAIIVIGVIGGAAVFAATRSAAPNAPSSATTQPSAVPEQAATQALTTNHPPIGNLPANHPPVGAIPTGAQKPEAALLWTAPARWEAIPHPSAMRVATYRVPKVAGDVEDGELSVTRAGGDVEQNLTRWVQQFDEPSRASARRATKLVGTLKVHTVDLAGTYTTMQGDMEQGFALAGAIVESPAGLHFFKLTGPAKTVAAARAELDALVASLRAR